MIRRSAMFSLLAWIAHKGMKWPYKSRAQITTFYVRGWDQWIRYNHVKP